MLLVSSCYAADPDYTGHSLDTAYVCHVEDDIFLIYEFEYYYIPNISSFKTNFTPTITPQVKTLPCGCTGEHCSS